LKASSVIYAGPYTEQNEIGLIKPGEKVLIIDGPSCSGKLIWWKVETSNLIGWTIEGDNSQLWLLNTINPKALLNNYDCPDANKIKLFYGAKGIIEYDLVNLRSQPIVPLDWDSNIVAEILKGQKVIVLEGPKCSHDGSWWQVRTGTNKIGWLRELLPDKVLIKNKDY